MKLYHYTSLYHLEKILKEDVLKTTSSNLLRPINPHLENGTFSDITDNYKPVVWFTTILDFHKARDCGLGGIYDKTEVAIQVETTAQNYYKWSKWAERNEIEKTWYEALKRTAPLWDTFYVSEQPIIISQSNSKIIFRPDIYKKISKGV